MSKSIHSTSAVIPADYEELFCYAHTTQVNGWPVPGHNIQRLIAQRIGRSYSHFDGTAADPERDEQGNPYPMWEEHKGGHQCDSCGAHFIEGSIFLHKPTGRCVAFGHICADKMSVYVDQSARLSMQGKRKSARKKALERAAKFAGLREFVAESDKELLKALKVDHNIVRDIRQRVIRFQVISDKQAALVKKIAREMIMPEEKKSNAPHPKGRLAIEGEIVGTKIVESAYGITAKMVVKVKADDGGYWKCYGTIPSIIEDSVEYLYELKGRMIRFKAALSHGNDPCFAFFKRPTSPEIVA